MTSQSTIHRRLTALRHKTVANGCTESEALAAASKIAELMANCSIDEDDLEIHEASTHAKAGNKSARSRLWPIIGWCTSTRCVTLEKPGSGATVIYYGVDPWPDIAVYLRDVCNAAIDREIELFKKGSFYSSRRKPSTKRRALRDFTHGMVSRLVGRLIALFEGQRNGSAFNQAGVVVEKLYPLAKSVRRKNHKVRFHRAKEEGWSAGGRINVAHGVDGQSTFQQKLIR